ncbi:Protein N-acetyltransferase, RimJ/RimL family [Streptomyces zhaozhouensis]|uniref:Protein N-acetyltransferase, RimJ/RimL family n=1 Tax=Streptomyces zhaozhouensis TaxID=1300267 RepID=A0A286DT18_9ACTN|nr:GNAT family N-acetyltransferase [Streptomyces zhaozhouensis]SOD61822.1 Protein N-acetyltransferase, RimJ/RimL family [Streptomyces zhaozhouensis]
MPILVPTQLTTERLLLRPWSLSGPAAVAAASRAPDWADDFPAEGDSVIADLLARGVIDPLGHRLLVERASGLVVGTLGFGWPPQDGGVELGYGVVPSRRGRGLATEAARALVTHALTLPGVRTVRASAEPANPASLRVLEKAGLRRTGESEGLVHFATA